MKPPENIPSHLYDSFTMSNSIDVDYIYRDDGANNISNEKTIYSRVAIDRFLAEIKKGKSFYYGKTDKWLYRALRQFGIRGKSVVIMGSVTPLYESICLCYGGIPTTVEYNAIISTDDRLKAMTVAEFEKSPKVFDAAFSISSFEHDGLGRYGDPINPDGDLLAMSKMKKIVKKDGLLYLAIPVGRDRLVWNLGRVYGRKRRPLLLKGWSIEAIYGFYG